MKNLLFYALISALFLSCSQKKSTFNTDASVSVEDQLPQNPFEQIAITSSIQSAENTMSTLYGNSIAANYARLLQGNSYPSNAVLYQVTWVQKPDSLWFGGKMPEKIKSIEIIRFNENTEDSTHLNYTYFSGSPLRKTVNPSDWEMRTQYILDQKIAVTP